MNNGAPPEVLAKWRGKTLAQDLLPCNRRFNVGGLSQCSWGERVILLAAENRVS